MKVPAVTPLVSTAAIAAFGLVLGCGGDRNDDLSRPGVLPTADGGAQGDDDEADDDDDDDDDDDRGDDDDDDDDDDDHTPGGPKLDVGAGACDAGDCGGESCFPPEHDACDEGTDDIANALGLGCPDEGFPHVSTNGNEAAIGIRSGFGPTGEWDPTEGAAYIVLGTGLVADLDAPEGEEFWYGCSEDLGEEYDMGETLPEPIVTDAVDCEDDATLIGSGDCSGTIGAQFAQGGTANDYTEVRLDLEVPGNVSSISYQFAFFSTEYPSFVGLDYNDMFVGWLESEQWTGNVSFDEEGNPISVNAGFLDYQDDAEDLEELQGTCMTGHGGTKWLTSTAPVSAGEDISLVFAIFDAVDSSFDSYVFIDGVEWGCDGGTPETVPAG